MSVNCVKDDSAQKQRIMNILVLNWELKGKRGMTMDAIMTSVQPFFIWLLQTTLIRSVVIGLILAAPKAMGGKLAPR